MQRFKLAIAIALVGVLSAPTRADEIFVCKDGRTIQLNSSNREKLKNDPCVIDWFKAQKAEAEARQAKSGKAPDKMDGIPPNCRNAWDCPHLTRREQPTYTPPSMPPGYEYYRARGSVPYVYY